MTRPKIAFFEFTSCEGCQLTVLELAPTHPELLEAVDIVQFREAMTERDEDYQIAFIEGSCVAPVRRRARWRASVSRRSSSSLWAPARILPASTPSATARTWGRSPPRSTATSPAPTSRKAPRTSAPSCWTSSPPRSRLAR